MNENHSAALAVEWFSLIQNEALSMWCPDLSPTVPVCLNPIPVCLNHVLICLIFVLDNRTGFQMESTLIAVHPQMGTKWIHE